MLNNTIKVIQHNVLHWRKRKLELSNTYRELNPDIILINSHCQTNNTHIKIPGYKCYQKNTLQTASDGTAIAIKHNIKHKVTSDFISDIIAIQVETLTGPITISTLYQPPSRDYIPTPDFTKLFRKRQPVYMIADLNANHPLFGYNHTNTKGNQLQKMIDNRLIQHVGPHFPTFFTRNRRTNPDIILSNNSTYHNYHITQGPITTSDHIPIIMTISSSPILIPSPARKNLKKANWENFSEEINNNMTIPNLQEASLEEIDQEIEKWYKVTKDAIANHIPTTHFKQLPSPTHSHNTKKIIISYNTMRQHAETHGWTNQHYTHYKILRTILQDTMTREANESWSNTIKKTADVYRDPKTFWKKIKLLCGESEPEPHYILNGNNKKLYTPISQEIEHRKIWEKVFGDETSDTESDSNTEDDNDENRPDVHAFLRDNSYRITPFNTADYSRLNTTPLDQEITPEDVNHTIKQSKNTAPGYSNINKIILNKLPTKAIQSLTNIFNASLSSGYFPDIWKKSIIKLIPKAGKNPHKPENYRPISLLEVPGKIFERIINSRIKQFLELHNKYNNNQFGFRANRSTHQALALITEQIAQNKSDKGHCQVVLRDISKAFDKVWHLGLKYKLLQLNIPITIEKLLCDFLDDRSAQIKIKNYTGQIIHLHSGVPQGSVLSPTLFTIYTSDIPQPRHGINIAYADDITQITGYPGKSKNMIKLITEREIKTVNEFERKWKIKTNINKFTPLHIASKTKTPLNIDGKIIQFCEEGTSLGLTISNAYIFHVKKRKVKADVALNKLYRLKGLPDKIKTHLVKALIIPILQYPPVQLHAVSDRQLSILQKVQNKALRFATNQYYPYTMTTEEIHMHTNTKPLNIFLQEQAQKIWLSLERMQNDTYLKLIENKTHIQKYHRFYPSSLEKIQQPISPKYK